MRTSVLGGEVTRRGFFGPMSRPAVAALGVSVAVTVLLWLGVGGIFGTVAGFVLLSGSGAALYPWGGRRSPAEKWLWHIRFLRRRTSGLNRFVPLGLALSGDQPRSGPRWPLPPPLGRVEPLDLRGTPHQEMFVLHHHNPGEEHYLSVLLQVDGQAHGLRSEQEYEDSAIRYGIMLSQLTREGSFIRGIQQLNRIVPHDPARHRAFVAARVSARAGMGRLVACYESLIDLTACSAEQHRNYLVARIPLTHDFVAEARRCGPGVTGWAGLVREELARMAELAERADLSRPRALGEQRTCAVLRSLQDPDFPIDQHEGVRWWNCWQSYVGEHSHVAVNGKWFSRTATVPRDAVAPLPLGPRWLAPLLTEVNPAVIRTLSVRMDLVPAAVARARAVRDVTMDSASKHGEEKKGRIDDGTDETLLSASERRLRDLAPGSGHHGVNWSMAISVTAADPGELRRVCTRIDNAAANCALSRLEWQDTWHDVAAVATYPLARGMAVNQ